MKYKKQYAKRRRKIRERTEVAYQNKDIFSKLLGESLKGKSFSVYGIRNPLITDVRPTNLPAIEANELKLDNLFLMEDGAYAIVDYESEYSEENKVKYIGYIARVSKKLYKKYGCFKPLRLIVIYTADVSPGSTNPRLDLGAFNLFIEEAFLINIDSENIKDQLKDKISRQDTFTDEDIMKLIIYPLTYKGLKAKQIAVTEAIDIAERMNDVNAQRAALSGIYVFADKVMTEEDAKRVLRRLDMTKIGRLLQEREEKRIAKAKREARREANIEAQEDKKESALKLLKYGDSVEKVAECMGLPLKEVQSLAAKM